MLARNRLIKSQPIIRSWRRWVTQETNMPLHLSDSKPPTPHQDGHGPLPDAAPQEAFLSKKLPQSVSPQPDGLIEALPPGHILSNMFADNAKIERLKGRVDELMVNYNKSETQVREQRHMWAEAAKQDLDARVRLQSGVADQKDVLNVTAVTERLQDAERELSKTETHRDHAHHEYVQAQQQLFFEEKIYTERTQRFVFLAQVFMVTNLIFFGLNAASLGWSRQQQIDLAKEVTNDVEELFRRKRTEVLESRGLFGMAPQVEEGSFSFANKLLSLLPSRPSETPPQESSSMASTNIISRIDALASSLNALQVSVHEIKSTLLPDEEGSEPADEEHKKNAFQDLDDMILDVTLVISACTIIAALLL